MSTEFLGYILAIITMLIYGVYMAPRKIATSSNGSFTFWMGTGILITSTAIFLIFHNTKHLIDIKTNCVSVIAGLIWATGNFAYSISITKIELTRATPLKNLSAIFGILLGIFIFNEEANKSNFKLIAIIISGIAIIVGATLLSRVGIGYNSKKKLLFKDYFIGASLAIWAAIAFSIYTIPMKIAFLKGASPVGFLFFMSIGIFIGLTLLALWSGWKPNIKIFIEDRFQSNKNIEKLSLPIEKNRWLAMLSGFGFAIGSLFANYAVKFAGVAITWPITKNSIIAVLFSAFILKDVDYKSSKTIFWTGISISLIGIIFMGLGA